ncbi:hypothetical protein D9619_003165 [Psilocybe cf. subviscida]|uniref:Glycosyltransferase family 8 protein n=1 Tax=Psilocybe cf. subviscida TaxID=2480587 RepID=A0A8H5EU33_9AGAR|nr:hypothetical protein D9619_003165 [Psilocybe cf. subviscida]
MSCEAAYVTLLTKTSYLPGVLVLDHCLRSVGSQYPLVVMTTPTMPKSAKTTLQRRGISVREVGWLHPRRGGQCVDVRFEETWTKLRVFELEEYKRVVLLDSDMIILKNMDDLMNIDLLPDHIAAAHVCCCNPRGYAHYPADWIPPHCAYTAVANPTSPPPASTKNSPRPYFQLNSGTVVLNPSLTLAREIVEFLKTSPRISEWRFPDQDLLSDFFKGRWKPLPWYYNALRSLPIVHPNLWSTRQIRCLHYIYSDKPWQSRETPPGSEKEFEAFNKWWWERFDDVMDFMGEMDPEGRGMVLAVVGTGSEF